MRAAWGRAAPPPAAAVAVLAALATIATLVATTSGAAAHDQAGSTLTGCQGELVSRDGDGDVIDRAVGEPPHRISDPDDGEPTFTSGHPFRVDPDGVVEWSGRTTTILTEQVGEISVWGITVADGRSDNAEALDQASGSFPIGRVSFVPPAGLVRFEGSLRGVGGQCVGSGWVRFEGDVFPSVAALAALAVTLAGIALLVIAQPCQRSTEEAS